MKKLKRLALIILILGIIVFAFKGCLYRNLVTYQSIGLRTNYNLTNENLIQLIDHNLLEEDSIDIESVIKKSLYLTSSSLRFTFDKNFSDPNKLINSKTANCIGYAAFFATICNYQLKKYNMSDQWVAEPHIGKLYFLGKNVHQYFNSPFFKDHDFVIIKNNNTQEIYAVDPSIHDYLNIDYITLKN